MRVVLTIVICCMFVQASFGQGKRKSLDGGAAAAPGIGFEIVNVTGKLDSMLGSNLKILSDGNIETIAVLDQRTSAKFSGQAKSTWLPPGILVRFSARFDGNGKAEAPLKSLDAFVTDPRARLTPDEMRNQSPGMYPEGGSIGNATKGLFNDKSSDAKGNRKADKKADKKTDKKVDKKSEGKKGAKNAELASLGTPQTYRVVAQVMQVQQNTMFLRAGNQTLSVEIDPAATINVSLPHVLFAVPGDAITLSGLRSPRDPKFVQVEKIEVKATKLLGLDGTQAAKGGRGSTKSTKSGKGASKTDDPAEGKNKSDKKSKK